MEPNRTILAPHCERAADDSCDSKLCLTSVKASNMSPGGGNTVLVSLFHINTYGLYFHKL